MNVGVGRKHLRDSHEDTGTRTKSANEVACNGESTNAGTTKGGSGRNNTLELTVHALVTVTGHNETLLLELLGNITRAGARDLNPGLRESGASKKHVSDKDGGVDRIEESVCDVEWWRPVVALVTCSLLSLGGKLTCSRRDRKLATFEQIPHGPPRHREA